MSGRNKRMRPRRNWCIYWLRCSTWIQADTSLDDQRTVLDAYCAAHGLIKVDEIVLTGVSGLAPKIHKMAQELVNRKIQRDDFDTVLVHDLSRLTRMGALDGNKIEFEFRNVGIDLISANDDVPQGDFVHTFKSLKYDLGNQVSKATSLGSTRGVMGAMLRGDVGHSRTAPYGTDRLILGPNGEPRFILHLLRNGIQQKLDPTTREVIEVFAPGADGRVHHYRKQKNERSVLTLGDATEVAAVRMIFELFYIDGLGCYRIARRLNDLGAPAPTGGGWGQGSVQWIATNTIYLGRGMANVKMAGRYYMRSQDGPIPTDRPYEELNRPQPPRVWRDAEEWFWTDEPRLYGFLPEHLREPARRGQDAYWARRAAKQKVPPQEMDRHRDNGALLKHLLKCSKTGAGLSGRSMKKGRFRYYAINKAHRKPSSKSEYPTEMLPARTVERFVVQQLAMMLRSMPTLREKIRDAVLLDQRQRTSGAIDVAAIRKEMAEVDQQLLFLVDELGAIGLHGARERAAQLTAQRERLQGELSAVEKNEQLTTEQIDERIDRVMADITEGLEMLKKEGRPILRRLLESFLAKAVVDLKTRHLEIEFRLPKSAILDGKGVCLAPSLEPKAEREAEASDGYLLRRSRIYWLGDAYVGYAIVG